MAKAMAPYAGQAQMAMIELAKLFGFVRDFSVANIDEVRHAMLEPKEWTPIISLVFEAGSKVSIGTNGSSGTLMYKITLQQEELALYAEPCKKTYDAWTRLKQLDPDICSKLNAIIKELAEKDEYSRLRLHAPTLVETASAVAYFVK